MKYLYIFTILLTVFFSSCIEDCISTRINDLEVGFYRSGRAEDVPYFVNILETRLNAVVRFQDNDSLQLDSLELNPAANQINVSYDLALYDYDTIITGDEPDDFIVRRLYTDTITADLSLNYDRIQRVISEECGVEQTYTNITTEHQGFDSVRVVNKDINRLNEERVDVKLYL